VYWLTVDLTALMVNDAGPLEDFEADLSGVIAEAEISSIVYERR
jgi:hypothetical protein